MPNIEIEMDRVLIDNQIVKRPARITRSEWMDYWEKCKEVTYPYVVQDQR